MIQRIQSVYLLLVATLNAGMPFAVALWRDSTGKEIYAIDEPLVLGAFFISAFFAVVAILLFKRRQTQFVLNRLNILLNVTLLGFFVYWSLMLPGEMRISEKGIGMLIPIVSIVLLVLSNKAIMKDEALVKSADRFR
ncbi:DUF4293 domain-containing protein [Gangjinia marincola]|uniref:DUF4293 domain-containing protein n=1 Tax=Gangjinia marincola TaxID=578463 RepID=A0ABP3Y122_9FLAO